MAKRKKLKKKQLSSKKVSESKEQKFIIRYGVGAGMNDADNFKIITTTSIEDAKRQAYYYACETFHSYDYGLYGLDDRESSEEEINEEMEDWIEFDAWEYTEEKYNEIIEKHGKQAIE